MRRYQWIIMPKLATREENVLIYKELTGLILGLHPANERHRYKVTLSLIGWAQPKINPGLCLLSWTKIFVVPFDIVCSMLLLFSSSCLVAFSCLSVSIFIYFHYLSLSGYEFSLYVCRECFLLSGKLTILFGCLLFFSTFEVLWDIARSHQTFWKMVCD